MARGSYNGFTVEDQKRGGQLQTTGFNNGMLVRQWECVACLVSGSKPGEIIAHLEDYSDPFDGAIWLCYRCHTVLHARFDHEDAWNKYRQAIRGGFQWPLTNSYHIVMDTHCGKFAPRLPEPVNEPRWGTILDDIADGNLVPGPEAYERMKLIHEQGVKFFKAQNQATLF